MQEANKYNIQKLLSIMSDIEKILGGEGIVDYIAVTPNEFSVYINQGVSMLLVSEINNFKEIFKPDTVFFNENNPQLIIANTRLNKDEILDENIKYFVDFVNHCAEFICPCTGSEIHLRGKEIQIFLDQTNLLHDEYMGVYNLIDESNSFFTISLNQGRPYIGIMSSGDVLDE